MKTEMRSEGFTIVEVTIVLTVTSVLLVGALLIFAGKQRDVQFGQSVDDTQLRVNQLINNVQTGYYNKTSSGQFDCEAGPNGPIIDTLATSDQGTNDECIFIGRAIHFTRDPDVQTYNLVGLRNNITGGNVTSIAEAKPQAIDGGNIEAKTLLYGLKTEFMYYTLNTDPPGTKNTTGVVAFVSNFGQSDQGGSTTAKLYALDSTTINVADNPLTSLSANTPAPANFYVSPASVVICLNGDTSKYGILTIGNSKGQLATTLKIVNKSTNPTECSP